MHKVWKYFVHELQLVKIIDKFANVSFEKLTMSVNVRIFWSNFNWASHIKLLFSCSMNVNSLHKKVKKIHNFTNFAYSHQRCVGFEPMLLTLPSYNLTSYTTYTLHTREAWHLMNTMLTLKQSNIVANHNAKCTDHGVKNWKTLTFSDIVSIWLTLSDIVSNFSLRLTKADIVRQCQTLSDFSANPFTTTERCKFRSQISRSIEHSLQNIVTLCFRQDRMIVRSVPRKTQKMSEVFWHCQTMSASIKHKIVNKSTTKLTPTTAIRDSYRCQG